MFNGKSIYTQYRIILMPHIIQTYYVVNDADGCYMVDVIDAIIYMCIVYIWKYKIIFRKYFIDFFFGTLNFFPNFFFNAINIDVYRDYNISIE